MRLFDKIVEYLILAVFNNWHLSFPGGQSSRLDSSASRHYVGTVAVDLPPATKNVSIPTIIYLSHRLICTLSVDLAVKFT